MVETKPEPEKLKKKCFVIMPFSKELKPVYDRIYEPVIRDCDLEPIRVDGIFRAGLITKDIFDGIASAELVLADLTGANPNVYYELGIAHRERKPVILTSQNLEEDIRFDVKSLRCIEYKPGLDVFWNDNLREDLKRAIVETITEPLSSIATPWLGSIDYKGAHSKREEKEDMPDQLNQILDVVTSLHSQIARQSDTKMSERYQHELQRRMDELEVRYNHQQIRLKELHEKNFFLESQIKAKNNILKKIELESNIDKGVS